MKSRYQKLSTKYCVGNLSIKNFIDNLPTVTKFPIKYFVDNL